jgi:acyl-CoA reductase-like NAD-dependent aldehyde dehydrogenase
MLIGGEFRDTTYSGETIEAINPATGQVCGLFPRGGQRDVDDAVKAARDAFETWRYTHPLQRAAAVRKLADLIADSAKELAALDVMENGSPIGHMRLDAGTAESACRYLAGLALEARGETIPGSANQLTYTLQQPYGVVGRIIPFNHPLMFAAAQAAAPLLTGNTMVIKPSEHTSLSTLKLAELFAEAFPPGVVNVITGTGIEAGDALVSHPHVRRIAFTGSAEIGRKLQERAGQSPSVKHVSLELGGKNPIVVLPDADVDAATDGALKGMAFTWQGQSCGSTSRLLVHQSVHEEFVARLAAKMSALKQGMPEDETTEIGAIAHQRQYDKVMSYIELGKREGLELVVGGSRSEDPDLAAGLFIQPTLFNNVSNRSRLAQEEIFGPVLVAMPFDTDEEAIAIANDIEYGLSASVWTRDLGRAHRFARDFEAGYVWVNNAGGHIPGAPHGGWKNSGVGREENLAELYSYTQTKMINVWI